MNTARNITAILGGSGAGLAIGSALSGWGPRITGLGIAIGAAAFLAWDLVRAIQADRREQMRRGRDAVWQRRIQEQPRHGMRVVRGEGNHMREAWEVQR